MKLTFGTLLDSDSMLLFMKMCKTQTAHSNNKMNQITLKGHLNSFWLHFRHCLFLFFNKGLQKNYILIIRITLDKHFSLIKLIFDIMNRLCVYLYVHIIILLYNKQ